MPGNVGSGYVNLQKLWGMSPGGGQGLVSPLLAQAGQPGQQQLAGNMGGLQTLLQERFGAGQNSPYTPGEQRYDAFLAGQAGGGQLGGFAAQQSASPTMTHPAGPGSMTHQQPDWDAQREDRLNRRMDPYGRLGGMFGMQPQGSSSGSSGGPSTILPTRYGGNGGY